MIYIRNKEETILYFIMANEFQNPKYTLSDADLKTRKNVMLYSNEGLHLREQLQEQKKLEHFMELNHKEENQQHKLPNICTSPYYHH